MYLQSIKSVEHYAAKPVNKSILKKSRHIGFDVFIVHSSMAVAGAVGGRGGHDRIQLRIYQGTTHAQLTGMHAPLYYITQTHTQTQTESAWVD